MHNKRFITKAHVHTVLGKEYTLSYYLTTNTDVVDSLYGIEIEAASDGNTASNWCGVKGDEKYVSDLIEQLAKNFVFPDTLQEIIHDISTKHAV